MEAANRVVKDTSARKNEVPRPPGTVFERGAAAFRDSVLRDIHAKHVEDRMALQTKFYDQQASLNAEYARLLRNLRSTALAKSSESVADEQKQIEDVQAAFAKDPWAAMKKYQMVSKENCTTDKNSTTTARQDSATAEPRSRAATPLEESKPIKVWSPPATKDEAQLLVDYATSNVIINDPSGKLECSTVNGTHNGTGVKAMESAVDDLSTNDPSQKAEALREVEADDHQHEDASSKQGHQESSASKPIALD